MRHQNKTIKLGRTADHRRALLANQVCALIHISESRRLWRRPKRFVLLPNGW